ncbi:MFS transporter [Paucibacter sp. KBW04]|uniref:VC0807 family protein n=1 Tax=Paucibacter sp. KBW04 TaxID=2153361 RepID=UPI000F56B3CF|nr:VC0807 family protein [Paucibacter sp. KBW04]RQO55587.1 MFS transporter [Paucibacter sp. KBW04]
MSVPHHSNSSSSTSPTPSQPNTLTELMVTLLAPSLVLMQLSSPARLGALGALLLALALPLGWAAYTAWRERRFSWMAGLGVFSTLMTGGIGLLALDPQWLAVKEAAVPGVIGLVVAGSALSKKPLVHLLVFSPQLMDVPRIEAALTERKASAAFERSLRLGTLMLAGSFAFSSIMNYGLARWIVQSPAGSEAFNAELGRMNLLSWPVIVIPSTLLTMAVLFYLARSIRRLTGLTLEDCLRKQA